MSNFTRNIRDILKEETVAVASGGASTPAIDLEQTQGGNIENVVLEFGVNAIPTVSDSKTITMKVQDSANGTDWADVDPLTQTTIASTPGNGTAAKYVRARLAPSTRRYIRVNQTITATPGTLTGGVVTARLLF